MKIIALVPAYNEAERIGQTLTALEQIPELDQIVVIDDGSTDNTSAVATQYNARVITLPSNQGKGGALNVGWQAVAADIYLLIDADLQASAIHARKLLMPLLHDEADMTIAHFTSVQVRSGKMGFGLVKTIARLGIRHFTGLDLNSPLSGQRGVRAPILEACRGFAADFGVEIALTIEAARHGFRIQEVPVPMTHRATGRNLAGFKHRGRQLWHVSKVLYRMWRETW